MTININDYNLENLEIFEKLLKKSKSTLINEALELFFEEKQKELLEENLADENAMTKLSYDEFWDDVEL